MTREKWTLIALLVVLTVGGVYQWVSTAPTWSLYHREFSMVTSVDEFDDLMAQVQGDVAQNFGYGHPIDSASARETIALGLPGDGYGPLGPNTRVAGYFVHGWCWVWDGAGIQPGWSVVRHWRDTWRKFDYASPKTKEAQFSMMGFTPSPAVRR